MLTRLKWFTLGSAVTIGAAAYLGGKVKHARERITVDAVTRAGVDAAAGLLAATGRRLQRSGVRWEPGSDAPDEG